MTNWIYIKKELVAILGYEFVTSRQWIVFRIVHIVLCSSVRNADVKLTFSCFLGWCWMFVFGGKTSHKFWKYCFCFRGVVLARVWSTLYTEGRRCPLDCMTGNTQCLPFHYFISCPEHLFWLTLIKHMNSLAHDPCQKKEMIRSCFLEHSVFLFTALQLESNKSVTQRY